MSAGLSNLISLYNQEGRDFVLDLLDKFVVIKEKNNGANLYFKKDGDHLSFYRSNLKPISIIDRTITSIYEKPINHILSVTEGVQFPSNYMYGIKYDYVNESITLDEIRVYKSRSNIKFIDDLQILQENAKSLEISSPKIIHYGRLSNNQKTGLLKVIINPSLLESNLSNIFNTDNDELIIKFLDKMNENVSAKILDPKKEIKIKNEVREPSDTYSIALQDVLEFIQTFNFDTIKIKGEDNDQKILNILADVYAKYMAKNGYKYSGIEDLDGPNFSKNIPSFDVNSKFVINKNAQNYLAKSQINKDLFKLFLGTFIKKKKKTTVLIDENTRFEINKIIDIIMERIKTKPVEKETVPTFEEYFYNRYQKRALMEAEELTDEETYIIEGATVTDKSQGKTKVNIVVGRFQPPTLGHVKLLRQLHAVNSLPVVVVQVRSKSGQKTPFDNELITRIWMDITKQYKFIEGVVETQTGFIYNIIDALRPLYEPVLWGTGSDRLKDYEIQISKYGPEANVLKEFQPYEVKRTGKNISATKVREAILEDNQNEFKKLTPKAEHRYYKQLRAELLQSK
jgi:phosphopantetheine adenylyltransferase